ncbi:MAG TPA: hypothetical protein DCZ94_21940 [Lentisphaeria bacterium]|nr:MAG: hypothetical protein A2X48_19220 [Lentisphaerae bacterium GWF2_49_21]HBC89608.1 hypothetical protein [Lentisphaeria bacterium]
MKRILLYLCLAGIFSILPTFSPKAEDYDYGKDWDVRARLDVSDFFNCLITIKNNEEKYPWEAEPAKTVQALFVNAKLQDEKAFSSLFDAKADAKDVRKFYEWFSLYAKYWETMEIVSAGHSKADPSLAFFAVVSGEEPREDPFVVDRDTRITMMKGFKRVIYLRKTGNLWKVELGYKDKNLENLLDLEVFLSCRNLDKDLDLKKKMLEKKEKINLENKLEEARKQDIQEFMDSYSKYYSKEDLMRKYRLMGKINQGNFKELLKAGLVKVLEKPIIISNIGAPLEDGISDKNPVDYIRRELYGTYTAPMEEIVKLPDSGREVSWPNWMRKNNQKTFQVLYYASLEFDGEIYCYIGGFLFNPDDRMKGKCKEDTYRLKKSPGGIYAYPSKGEDSLLAGIAQTNVCLKHIIWNDISKDEYWHGFTIASYEEKLKKRSFYPLFRVHDEKDCTPYMPGIDIEKLPTVKIDETTFKEPLK